MNTKLLKPMKLIKQYPTCLLIILIATLFCQNTMAQKNRNKKKAKQEVVQEEEENLDIWTETPICKVMIVDSIVVDKKELVQQIPLPGHLGKIFIDTETGNYIYENDFADMRYITQTDTSGYHNIYRQILLAEKWGAPELIQINGDKYDYINPYVMPDGQTLFFAARSRDDNEGKTYSIYTTTFDPETNTFLEPQRLPYPFNSDGNNIVYIEDEVNSIGWFASTRRQDEEKVCIYTIATKQPWEYYDNENYEPEKLKSLALIERISDTWPSQKQRDIVLEKINQLNNDNKNTEETNKNINFVINNNTIYDSFSDFKNEESKNLYIKLLDQKAKQIAYKRQLNEYRKLYHNSTEEGQKRITDVITATENELKSSYNTVRSLTKKIRNLEQ